MTNKEVGKYFKLLGKLMEIHGENSFKIRSYQNASFTLDRLPQPVADLSPEELAQVKGFGQAIVDKITTILQTGELPLLNTYLEKTPEGVIEMLQIKGIGGKKIGVIWRDLGITSLGELLYACNENRIAQLKGFGPKTQENIIQAIEYLSANRDKFLYARLEIPAMELQQAIEELPGVRKVLFTGALRRRAITLKAISLLVVWEAKIVPAQLDDLPSLVIEATQERKTMATYDGGIPVKIYHCTPEEEAYTLWRTTGAAEHMEKMEVPHQQYPDETALYAAAKKPYILPEMREGISEWEWSREHTPGEVVKLSDIQGVIHSHSTYSDGAATLEQMATACRDKGYAYMVISDHSQSAFYANGLDAKRIAEQHKEIDALNARLAPFTIYKSIESDILNDGQLDYPDEILAQFDLVIASVHSNLRMTEEKAMERLLKAVRSPFTTILGHPTGRLLLSREGYPVHHHRLLQACAEHNVVIELNANPHRLDLDWTYISTAMRLGVMVAINPDAHSIDGIDDIKYGVYAARKGGLVKSMTLNTLTKDEFDRFLHTQHQKRP